MTANLLLLAGGVAVLYFGAEWLVRGSARLAAAMGVHPIVVGLTVVSFGTSAPELVVSLVAALDGKGDIAVGNVLGSNLANIGLILGLTALVKPINVDARLLRREVPLMLAITLILYPLILDHGLGRLDGFGLVCVLVIYLVLMFKRGGGPEPQLLEEIGVTVEATRPGPRLRDLTLVLAGCLALVLGARAIVTSAQTIAEALGISQLVIGLTVIAIGTSLPELATSVVAALRGQSDIAIGNVIGSNIFNVAAILGITASVTPIAVNPSVLTRELPAVLFLSFLAWPLSRTDFQIKRWEAALLLGVYVALGLWLVGGAPAPPL